MDEKPSVEWMLDVTLWASTRGIAVVAFGELAAQVIHAMKLVTGALIKAYKEVEKEIKA